jgi:hypothetical protein
MAGARVRQKCAHVAVAPRAFQGLTMRSCDAIVLVRAYSTSVNRESECIVTRVGYSQSRVDKEGGRCAFRRAQ